MKIATYESSREKQKVKRLRRSWGRNDDLQNLPQPSEECSINVDSFFSLGLINHCLTLLLLLFVVQLFDSIRQASRKKNEENCVSFVEDTAITKLESPLRHHYVRHTSQGFFFFRMLACVYARKMQIFLKKKFFPNIEGFTFLVDNDKMRNKRKREKTKSYCFFFFFFFFFFFLLFSFLFLFFSFSFFLFFFSLFLSLCQQVSRFVTPLINFLGWGEFRPEEPLQNKLENPRKVSAAVKKPFL